MPPMTSPAWKPASSRTPGPDGGFHTVRTPGPGRNAATRVLAVDAELEGVPAQRRVVEAERLAVGDAELLADQVDARDLLGHRVLDLQAGVDLEERDRAVDADEELAGAGAVVAGLLDDRLRRAVELLELVLREVRRRRLLDQLLVPSLQRAVAGRHDDDVAVLVGEHLGLDVAWAVEVALDEALAAAERRDGLADRGVEQLGDLLDRARDLEAAAAAAERRLDRDGQSVGAGELLDLLGRLDRVGRALDLRRARALRDVARRDLVAEGADRLGRRADPGEPGVDDGLGEVGVLRQEPVAGVHGVGTGLAGDVEQLVDDEVGLGRARAAEGVGLVGGLHVQRVAVGVGVDSDARDAGVAARPGDADGDLATVGDEDLRDGHRDFAPDAGDVGDPVVGARPSRAAAPPATLPERDPLAPVGGEVRRRDPRGAVGAASSSSRTWQRRVTSSTSSRVRASSDWRASRSERTASRDFSSRRI